MKAVGWNKVAVCADGQQSCLSWMHGDVGKHWNASLYSPAAVRGVDAHLLPVYTEVLARLDVERQKSHSQPHS